MSRPILVRVFFGRGDIPELVSLLRTTYGIDCEEEDDLKFSMQISSHAREHHSMLVRTDIKYKVDLERMFRFIRAFWKSEKEEYEDTPLSLPDDCEEGDCKDGPSAWIACFSMDEDSKGDDELEDMTTFKTTLAQLQRRRKGIRPVSDNLQAAVDEAASDMEHSRIIAEDLVRNKLGYKGDDWQGALQDFRNQLDGRPPRPKQILTCDVCDAEINLKSWPGKDQGFLAALDLGFKEGWFCATCAKFIHDTGHSSDVCPTIFCSAKCKKIGAKTHAIREPGGNKLSQKDVKKVTYCQTRIEERATRIPQTQDDENMYLDTLCASVGAVVGTSQPKEVFKVDA